MEASHGGRGKELSPLLEDHIMDAKSTLEELELPKSNERLLQEIKERKRMQDRIERLNHLKEDLIGPGSVNAKIKLITDVIVEIFEADFARIWLTKTGDLCNFGCTHAETTKGSKACNHRDRCLHLLASSGRYTHLDGNHRRVPFGCYKIGLVASGDCSKFLTNDVMQDPRIHNHEWARTLGLVSFAGYRLLAASGEVIGVLALFSQHAITADTDAQLEGLANTTAQVIQATVAEEALKESEERYRSLFNNNHAVMLLVDPQTADIVDANPAAVSFYGWSKQELTGKKITDINTLTKKQVFKEIERSKTQQRRHFFFSHRLASGEIRDVEVYSGPIKIHERELLCSIIHDITSRKRAEAALVESENRFRTLYKESKQREQLYESLLKSIPDAVAIYNLNGEATYINPTFTQIFGFTMKDVKEKRISFVPESEKDKTEAGYGQILQGEPISGFETSRLTKDGRILDIALSSSCFYDHEGNATGVIVILRDVTETKKTERQLQQAQRMEAIGTLAGGIAHDFNNLLMGIQGRASLTLMDMDSSHPHFTHLKGIEDHVKSAADLTKQLLAFSRGGKYEVKPTDLKELVKKSSEMFGRTKKEITIRQKSQKEIWAVEADQSQIEQVLLNMYVNAWQSMPGGGELHLEIENVTLDEGFVKPYDLKPGKYVKISVADTGVGMDKAIQARIFDPFFTTKEMGRGTGLGLASAYGIINNHGGIINVHSEKGRGATFNIFLPASGKKVTKVRGSTEEIVKGSETILLVDDEDIIIDVSQELLKTIGYKVLTAKSGKAAVELYKDNRDDIDMVILDMIMPDMDGGKTYDRLKEISPDLKVLLSSGYSIDGQASEIMLRGCNGFIQKPFNIKELSQTIRAIFSKG